MYNNVIKTQWKENPPLVNFWVEQPIWASHLKLFGLHYQCKVSTEVERSTEAQECILVEIIETLLWKVEEVTVRNDRIIILLCNCR